MIINGPLLILSFTQNIVRACSMLYPYEGYRKGYRSVTPLDAARVNRTIFHNHSVCSCAEIQSRRAPENRTVETLLTLGGMFVSVVYLCCWPLPG